jgi:hypothetical protein
MVFNLTHSQIILRYKENGGRIESYTIVIMLEITKVVSLYWYHCKAPLSIDNLSQFYSESIQVGFHHIHINWSKCLDHFTGETFEWSIECCCWCYSH